MRWVIAFFIVLVSIPAAQVAVDAWHGRPGLHLSVVPRGPDLAVARRRHFRLYDPIAPWFPSRAKTG
jgi:hypothetical protein